MSTAATIEHHARARVERGGGRCWKHALGRAATDREQRRDDIDVFPQVTLGKRAWGIPARVGVVCSYDPTTGTFLSPDPIDGQPGEPTEANEYHYVDNDPLNKVDPLGLRPEDGEFDGDVMIDCPASSGSGGAVVCGSSFTTPMPATSLHMSDRGLWFTAQFEDYIGTPDDSAGSCAIGFGTGVWMANTSLAFAASCDQVNFLDGADPMVVGVLDPGGRGFTTGSEIFPAPLPLSAGIAFLRHAYDLPDFRQIASRITVLIPQEQFDAILDLAYNHGPYSESIGDIIDAVNDGDHATAAQLIEDAPTGGYAAVEDRRRLQSDLYATGIYGTWGSGALGSLSQVPDDPFVTSNVSRYFG